MELSVDVAADGDGSLDGLNIAFLDENLLNLFAKDSELPLWQDGALLDRFKPVVDITATHFVKNFYI